MNEWGVGAAEHRQECLCNKNPVSMWHGTATLVCDRFSQQRTRLPKREPGMARLELRGVAVAEVDQEVRLHMPLGEELLITTLALAAGVEELPVEQGAVETGHRAAVEPESAGGDDQVGALE